MKQCKKIELNIYWNDGCTIEKRYFPNVLEAENYCKENGISESDYEIFDLTKIK